MWPAGLICFQKNTAIKSKITAARVQLDQIDNIRFMSITFSRVANQPVDFF